jgi:ABC-type Fe3+ transport system substrate-binding protein
MRHTTTTLIGPAVVLAIIGGILRTGVRRSRRCTVHAAACLASLALLAAGCSGPSTAIEEPTIPVSERQRTAYEQARTAGGEIRIFVGTASNEEIDYLLEDFSAAFPGLTVQYISGTANSVVERFLTERRAGLDNVDVLMLPGVSAFERIVDEHLLREYEPEEWTQFPDEPGTRLGRYAHAFANNYNSVCYNPENITPAERKLLDSYEGWTSPVWRDRAALVDPTGFGYRYGLTYWTYQDPGLGEPWLTDLARNVRPTVFNGGSVPAAQVIAGEYDVVFNLGDVFGVRAQRTGAPLQCTSGEYAPYYVWSSALSSDAPNPAGGEVFVDWLFSEHGQLALQESLAYSGRRAGLPPVVDAEWWDFRDDSRLIDEQLVRRNQSALVDTVERLFGGAVE